MHIKRIKSRFCVEFIFICVKFILFCVEFNYVPRYYFLDPLFSALWNLLFNVRRSAIGHFKERKILSKIMSFPFLFRPVSVG